MQQPRNIVGPKVRMLRKKHGLTQPMLSARCNLLGWDLSRETLAKIESQIRWVADCEIICLATALNENVESLLCTPRQAKSVIKQFFQERH